MGFPAPAGRRKIRGKLIAAPTTLDPNVTDYGGDVLGDFDQIAWNLEALNTTVLRAQEYGGAEYEGIDNAIGYRVVARLRSWDAGMLGKVFPGAIVSTGTVTQQPKIRAQVTDFLGRRLSDRAFVLLLATDAPESDLSIICYAAAARVRQVANVQYNLSEGWGFPAIFSALPTTGGVILEQGRIRDLSLTP